jgi:hypothetical protein
MNYHYETQPVPNPLSYYLHQSPAFVHKAEVLANHIAELGAPLLILIPVRSAVIMGGLVQIAFMVGLWM